MLIHRPTADPCQGVDHLLAVTPAEREGPKTWTALSTGRHTNTQARPSTHLSSFLVDPQKEATSLLKAKAHQQRLGAEQPLVVGREERLPWAWLKQPALWHPLNSKAAKSDAH